MRPGCRRSSSAAVSAGTPSRLTSRIGAPCAAAAAPPASASAKPSPVATRATGTPGSKPASEIAAAVANRDGPASRLTSTPVSSASWAATPASTAPSPPRITTRAGCRRCSSVALAAGTLSRATRSTGASSEAASAPPVSASANPSPVATYAVATPGANVAAEIAAAVA